MTNVTRFVKTDHPCTISDKVARDGQVCFFNIALTSSLLCKTLRSQYRWCWTSGGFNRMACTQSISQTLVLSSVVVCDWCGDLFWHMAGGRGWGQGQGYGVLCMSVLFLLDSCCCHPPSPPLSTTGPLISTTPDIIACY